MFALGIELLMRRAIITRYDRREEPEWPPHPDRVFMALVAGFGETGEDEKEASALRWLENLDPPSLAVSLNVSRRNPCTSYVPVNDNAEPVLKGKPVAPMGGMPLGRIRQARQFPAVVPDSPVMYLRWNAEIPQEIRSLLETLCSKVTSLGHSATPVRMWIEDSEVTPDLIPGGEIDTQRMRVFGPGRLDYLISRYRANLRPQPAQWRIYGKPPILKLEAVDGPFDPGLIVLRQVGGRKFPLESAGMIADALRATLMKHKGNDLPNWLTGHASNGGPTKFERPAIFPLAFVNRKHADGHLLGVAIAVPRDFTLEDSGQLFELLLQQSDRDRDDDVDALLQLGIRNPLLDEQIGIMELELDERPQIQRATTLKLNTWVKASDTWTTITPLMLPRFPRRGLLVEEVVREAVVEAGYPAPVQVETGFAPFMIGVPHTRSFFMRPRPGRPPRPLIHARIKFEMPVRGPVLIGAGRYIGFGTCRPTVEEETR